MNRVIKWQLLFFGLLLSLLLGRETQAQTINAASCSESSVAAALSSITTDGTTVVIPSCAATIWTTPLNYTQTKSFTIQGAGAVSYSSSSISGTGTDNTILEDNINRSGSDTPMININTIAGKSFRLTGIAFTSDPADTTPTFHGIVIVGGNSSAVRIDHNHFNQLFVKDLGIGGAEAGVIDHNQFDAGYDDEFHIAYAAEGWGGDTSGQGNGSWADSSHFGTSQFMFTENNNFQWVNGTPGEDGAHAFAFDCVAGGRFVFRYNAMGLHEAWQTHGTGSGNNLRSCRAYEMYNNVIKWSSNTTADQFFALIQMEGGAGYFWGNTITGFNTFIDADVVRTNNSTYRQGLPPSGWGYCGTTLGPSPWDGNLDSSGRPCLDSIGRGQGDLISGLLSGNGGTSPFTINTTTGAAGWPNQASDPDYIWDNIYNPVTDEPDHYFANGTGLAIAENRDYYLQLPNFDESATFNGTAGVGQGLLSARPGTCSVQVGYWATDTNTLYLCKTANTWTASYTPYTYPHPLTLGSVSGVAAPTGLTAVVN